MKRTPKRHRTCEEVAHLMQACIENPLVKGENRRIDMGYVYYQGDSQGCSKCTIYEKRSVGIKHKHMYLYAGQSCKINIINIIYNKSLYYKIIVSC